MALRRFSLKLIYKNGQIRLSTLMNGACDLKRAIEAFDLPVDVGDVDQKRFERFERQPFTLFFIFVGLLICLVVAGLMTSF